MGRDLEAADPPRATDGHHAHGARKVIRYATEERIPLFAEVLAEVPSIAINIELKLDLNRWWPLEVATVTAQLVPDVGAEDRVIVTSFDPRKLRAAVRASRRLAIGFCYDDTMLDFARPLVDRLPIRRADGELRPSTRLALTAMLDANVMRPPARAPTSSGGAHADRAAHRRTPPRRQVSRSAPTRFPARLEHRQADRTERDDRGRGARGSSGSASTGSRPMTPSTSWSWSADLR